MPSETHPISGPTAELRPLLSRTHLLLGLILLGAALLRLARLDLMAFEMDEGAACIVAVRYMRYGLLPLVGIKTSLQFYNSPLFIYVLSPIFLVATDPRCAAAFFALLGTAAVYVVYRTGREFFSPAVGLLAAAMMAVSPSAIEYSRRLWGHSLIQILCPVAFYLLLRWVVSGRPKAIFWLALIAAAAQQFHFSGALLWVQIILVWLLFRPRTDWVALVCGLALGLLSYWPFFFAQTFKDFLDLRIIGDAIGRGTGQPWRFDLQKLLYWLFAATDFGHNNFLQQGLGAFLAQIPLYRATRAIVAAAWVGGLVACGIRATRGLRGSDKWQSLREGGAAKPIILLTWSLVPLVAFLSLRVPVVAPYFLVVYPAPFLAIAWLVVQIWQRLEAWRKTIAIRQGLRRVVFFLFAAWVVHQLAFYIVLRASLESKGGGKGSYVSFGRQQAAMRFVANHAPGQTVMISEEHLDPSRGIDYRYWYLLWTFDRNMERFFPKNREKAEYWYLIRNMNYRVRSDFQQFLDFCPFQEFEPLRVYVIPRPGPWPRFGPAPPPSPT